MSDDRHQQRWQRVDQRNVADNRQPQPGCSLSQQVLGLHGDVRLHRDDDPADDEANNHQGKYYPSSPRPAFCLFQRHLHARTTSPLPAAASFVSRASVLRATTSISSTESGIPANNRYQCVERPRLEMGIQPQAELHGQQNDNQREASYLAHQDDQEVPKYPWRSDSDCAMQHDYSKPLHGGQVNSNGAPAGIPNRALRTRFAAAPSAKPNHGANTVPTRMIPTVKSKQGKNVGPRDQLSDAAPRPCPPADTGTRTS